MSISDLPAVNACFNALSTVFLSVGYVYIRRGRQTAHRNCMIAAVCTSALFLAGYLTYHFNVQGVTRFTNPEWFRPIYLVILLTHTVLATAILPLVIVSLVLAFRRRFETHRKVSRWTWPIWMYVSVTGVGIYLLLYQIFPQTPPAAPLEVSLPATEVRAVDL
jgi:putative membrane protein